MIRPRRSYRARNRWLIIFLLLAAATAGAQNNLSEHVFKVSWKDLNKTLAELHANTPGRLPILEGFVDPDVSALEKYQRAYYQYKLEVRPAGTGATSLRVAARVTAWFAGDKTTAAGYRELPSNGRLETDLIERLEEALQQKSAAVAGGNPSVTSSAPTPVDRASSKVAPALTAKPSPLGHTFPMEQPTSRTDLEPPDERELAEQKRYQQLSEQAVNLEEILRNQARPNDLAAVLKNGTPVFAKPIEPGDVLFQADAEDEFKVLDESRGWVHVQVSGISRGWIRRADMEMPGDAAADSKPPSAGPETHEETSPLDRVTRDNLKVDGIVLVIDAADGGMVAATTDSLRRWNTGVISDAAFRKGCWTDSPEALGETARRRE